MRSEERLFFVYEKPREYPRIKDLDPIAFVGKRQADGSFNGYEIVNSGGNAVPDDIHALEAFLHFDESDESPDRIMILTHGKYAADGIKCENSIEFLNNLREMGFRCGEALLGKILDMVFPVRVSD